MLLPSSTVLSARSETERVLLAADDVTEDVEVVLLELDGSSLLTELDVSEEDSLL